MSKNILSGIVLFFSLSLCTITKIHAQQVSEPIHAETEDSTLISLSQPKRKDNYWNRLIYGNVDRTREKMIDISFAAAPSYTREASFGIGGMASGLYRLDRRDSIMPPSDITMIFNGSIVGFYALGFRGNNYFKGNRSLLSYDIEFTTKPLDFWGISYEACAQNPVIEYTRRQIKVEANYQYQLKKSFYIGGALDFLYANVTEIDDISYLEGQKRSYVATGFGAVMQYDSRDFIPNPRRGMFLALRPYIYPQVLGNCGETLFRTTVIMDFYQKLWNGAILATDLYGEFNSEHSPWPLKEELGGNQRMRGYYGGRYIDNNIISGQFELRQHIVKRLGCTAWIGGGTVFPTFNQFDIKNILPTYGLGLRIEFKHNVNARIDYGFGKDTGGFVFNVGEAF